MKFPLGDKRLIRGWNEGLPQLRQGEKAIITCPPDYAYGDKDIADKVPANSTVTFQLELIEIVSEKKLMDDCCYVPKTKGG